MNVLPYVFATFAAIMLGAVVVSFHQAVRAALGLVDAQDALPEAPRDELARLLARKQDLLRALTELDFDREAGKLSDEDHGEERSKLRAEAKRVLTELDARLDAARAEVRAELEARRGASGAVGSAPAALPAESTPTQDAPAVSATPAAESTPGLVCAGCSTSNDADAAFCKRCGQALGGAS